MVKEANLLITYEPTHPGKAKDEVEGFLKELKTKGEFQKCAVQGLFLLRVGNARELTEKLTAIGKKKPARFVATFHWVPVDKWVKSSIPEMKKAVKKLVVKILPKEKWKMDINKRNYAKPRTLLITELTSVVDRQEVDLTSPKKIIRVEIIGTKAGISLLTPAEILDIPRLQREKA